MRQKCVHRLGRQQSNLTFSAPPKKHCLHLALHCSAILYTEQWGRAPAADSCLTVRRGKWQITWTQRRILSVILSFD